MNKMRIVSSGTPQFSDIFATVYFAEMQIVHEDGVVELVQKEIGRIFGNNPSENEKLAMMKKARQFRMQQSGKVVIPFEVAEFSFKRGKTKRIYSYELIDTIHTGKLKSNSLALIESGHFQPKESVFEVMDWSEEYFERLKAEDRHRRKEISKQKAKGKRLAKKLASQNQNTNVTTFIQVNKEDNKK